MTSVPESVPAASAAVPAGSGTGVSGAEPTRFDVRAYARSAQGSLRAAIDTAAFAQVPLPEPVLGALRFLRDAERGTMSQLRTMLVTPTHKDARMTSFLSAWAFEKFWIADALDAVVAAHPAVGATRPGSRTARIVRQLRERLRPITTAIVSNSIGPDVTAVHVTLGAVDQWVSNVWYDRVEKLAAHPELSALIERIRDIKQRQGVFFESEARARLSASPRAQRLVRARLRSVRFPVAGPFTSPREAAAVGRSLLVGAADRVAEVAARIHQLPGQARVAPQAVGLT